MSRAWSDALDLNLGLRLRALDDAALPPHTVALRTEPLRPVISPHCHKSQGEGGEGKSQVHESHSTMRSGAAHARKTTGTACPQPPASARHHVLPPRSQVEDLGTRGNRINSEDRPRSLRAKGFDRFFEP